VPIIEVEHLHKRYRDTVAVEDVSLTVEAGEIFGIVGPNGAGKTTTVELIEGLRTPDRGRVRVLGLDPWRDRAELRQRVGVQLQQSDLYDKVRVGEALELFASFYRDPADPGRLLERLGLAGKRNTSFDKLSGGQRQRLSIALALVGSPEVAILDELSTGLDPHARRDTWRLIEQVRAGGVTVVLVSHVIEHRSGVRRPAPAAGRAGHPQPLVRAVRPHRLPAHPGAAARPLAGRRGHRNRRHPRPAIFGGRSPDPDLPAVAAFVLLVAVTAGMATAFSRWGEVTTLQNEQRKQTIIELAEANAKLEAAMAENAVLQARLLAQAREAAPWTSASAWSARSTTPWPRVSPGSSPRCRRPGAPRVDPMTGAATSTTPPTWPVRACPRPAGPSRPSARSRWSSGPCAARWRRWSSAGRSATGSRPRSPPPAPSAPCTPEVEVANG
jgi:ABC-type Na+ transport system ATPase subunit NatA